MSDFAGKFLFKLGFFVLTFFLLYIYSFLLGMKIVEPIFAGTLNHPIRNLLYGCLLGSIISFIGTIFFHLIIRRIIRNINFSSWFRSVNLIFLYLSGFGAAIISMKGLLVNGNLITGNEILFNDQFSLIGLAFFIALFNYNIYNSLVLTTPREIVVIDWIQDQWRKFRETN